MADPTSASVTRPGARDLAMDVFAPTTTSLRSAVICLHGGAWKFGHRRDIAPQARALAAHGFTAIAAEYRLSGEAHWPAQLQDVRDVLAWTAREADALDIDPARIALLGCSAGGHLALMAAASAAAVVAIGAPPVLRLPPPEAGPNPIADLLGPGADHAMAAVASPMLHLSPDLPPICLIGCGGDVLVPPSETIALYTALTALGLPVALHLYHGHAHAFDALPSMLGPVQAEVALFLNRAMVDPERYERESLQLNPFARGLPPVPLLAEIS